MLMAVPSAAGAQQEGVPGDGFGVPPAGPSPGCQELITLRNEIQKHWWAIKRAHERSASVHEACPLFKSYLATETKLINSLVEHGHTCGAPPDVLRQLKENHAKSSQTGEEVCQAAAQHPRRIETWPPGDYWLPGQRLPGR